MGGVEYTALRKNGTTFPVIIHSNRCMRGNRPMGLRGLIIDLSRSKKMEMDLKRRAMAMDQSTEMIVITDTKGLITYVNPAFEQISGYCREEILGKSPRLLQGGKYDKMFCQKLWQTISGGKTWRGTFSNTRKNGDRYTEEATISPVFSDKAEIVSYVAVARDISDKLTLEAELQQAHEMEAIRSTVPIIMCTGFSVTMSKEIAESLGIKGFIMKPVVLGELSALIRKVLAKDESSLNNKSSM